MNAHFPSNILQTLLTIARQATTNERDAARLSECVFQRICEDPDLLADDNGLTALVAQTAAELWQGSELQYQDIAVPPLVGRVM